MNFESQGEYDSWIEGIAETWVEDFDRSENVVTVADACVVTHVVFEDGDQAHDDTLTSTAEPWSDWRADPASALRWTNAPAKIFNEAEGFRRDAVRSVAHDVLEAANAPTESEKGFDASDFDIGDVVAFDAYDDGHTRFEADEPVTGTVVAVSGTGTLSVRGIGAVNVEPEDVVEIVNKNNDAEV